MASPDDAVIALVFRVLLPPSDADLEHFRAFALAHQVELWLQPKGPDSIALLADGREQPPRSRLGYPLPEFGITMPYRPTDFTQVNHRINRVLVQQALRSLDPGPADRVLDLFCGLGNFTLPLARLAGTVLGIEGSAALVARAQANAQFNGLEGRAGFAVENLFEFTVERWLALNEGLPFDLLLIDPPRDGALAVAEVLAQPDLPLPRRLVYVSCNPATLARDCAVLVQSGRWGLSAAGAVNMFPHTSHVESMVVLDRLAPGEGASQSD
jgi:23S rRNA (uracil1939-C5)-methyltransferase